MSAPFLELVRDADVLPQLRALAPKRPMTWSEAHSVAERQAALLLDLHHVSDPPVPQFVIASLPGLVVDYRSDWPTSGMAVQSGSHWRIVIRANEPRSRQRFSLAHEFKHVLDDAVIDCGFARIAVTDWPRRAERLCNFFAACLLMPRPWVKHDWYGGMSNVSQLARRYGVSVEAMSTRLSELGLTVMTLAVERKHRHRGSRP